MFSISEHRRITELNNKFVPTMSSQTFFIFGFQIFDPKSLLFLRIPQLNLKIESFCVRFALLSTDWSQFYTSPCLNFDSRVWDFSQLRNFFDFVVRFCSIYKSQLLKIQNSSCEKLSISLDFSKSFIFLFLIICMNSVFLTFRLLVNQC